MSTTKALYWSFGDACRKRQTQQATHALTNACHPTCGRSCGAHDTSNLATFTLRLRDHGSMLIETIREDLKTAMKAKNAAELRTLRSVITAVQEAKTSGSGPDELDDDGVQKIITAQAKRRVEAAEAFASADRPEQEAAELEEKAILERYLPKGLDEAELVALVDQVLADNGFTEKADMGSAMKAVNAEVAGRADGRAVADLVKSKLA